MLSVWLVKFIYLLRIGYDVLADYFKGLCLPVKKQITLKFVKSKVFCNNKNGSKNLTTHKRIRMYSQHSVWPAVANQNSFSVE